MHRLSFLVFLLVVSLAAQGASAQETIEKTRKNLQGTWVLVVIRTDKLDASLDKIKEVDLKLVIDDKKIYRVHKGKRSDAATYTLRRGDNYMMLDNTNEKGITERGIVALHGDVLLFCVATDKKDSRPTEFKVRPGTSHVLTVWKREIDKREAGTRPLKETVVGRWKAQIELVDAKLQQMLKDNGVAEADLPGALEKVRKALSGLGMEVEVRADGSYTMTASGVGPKPTVENGKWKVAGEKGDVLTLKSTSEEPNAKTHTLTLTFRGDDEFQYESDDPAFKKVPIKTPVRFKRVKEPTR